MKAHIFKSRQNGFTFVELVAVLVIAGVLAAVILPRMNAGTGFDERGFRDRVVAGLRYAQKSAIASRRTVCASFSSPPASVSFQLAAFGAVDCAVSVPLIGPDSTPLVVTAVGGVSFAARPATLVFDAAGGAGNNPVEIKISDTLAITVEADTGYVH
jgi:MSHA pilin protein MshC